MLSSFHLRFAPFGSASKCAKKGLNRIARTMATQEFHFKEKLSFSKGGSVTLNTDNDVAVIRLDRPEKKNAFSGSMMVQLSDCVTKLELNCPRAIVVTGTEDSFSAGADLDLVRQNLDSNFAESMFLFMSHTLSRLRNLPAPSIALINGSAFGGGAELAVQCDLRLVTPAAVISFVHGQMGLTPGWGSGSRLVELLGYGKTMELLLTGRRINAEDAIVYGLACGKVNSVKEGFDWVDKELKGSARTLFALKSVVNCAKDRMNVEKDIFVRQWGAEDHRAALEKVKK